MSSQSPPPKQPEGGSGSSNSRGGGGGSGGGGGRGGGRGRRGAGGGGGGARKGGGGGAKAGTGGSTQEQVQPTKGKPEAVPQQQQQRSRNKNAATAAAPNKGGGGTSKPAGVVTATPTPPPQQKQQQPLASTKPVEPSAQELARRAQVRLQEQAAAAHKQQLEKEQRLVAARAKETLDRTAAVRDAVQLLRTLHEAAAQHKASRALFFGATTGNNTNNNSNTSTGDALKQARADFELRKKTLKADLKRCTAFVKKVKSGALYSLKPADVVADVASLNLSRYVEEVVAAVLESRPKVTELPVVTALSQAMHARYADFLPNLLPALWNAVLLSPSSTASTSSAGGAVGDAASKLQQQQRRLYVRVLTDFMVHGLLSTTDVHKLCKCVADWTGAAAHYAVTDAVATVAFCRAGGFEVLGVRSAATAAAVERIQTECAKLEQAEKDIAAAAAAATAVSEVVGAEPAEEKGASGTAVTDEAMTAPVFVSRPLLEEALEVVKHIQPVLQEQRAVPAATTDILSQHCLGAYHTLSSSLVQTHHKLQKLEKRCEQDRLLSGQLTANREKGLGDAHKLFDSLQKSVEALSDCLNQPVPHLVEEDDDENAALSGTGVEVWTKEAGGQGQEHLGPFDDEETRAFYCDIPDLLATIPPALLGISEEEIERRKEANTKKYGVGGVEEETADDAAEPYDVTPTSEAQLDAAEEGEILADDEEEGGERRDDEEENKDTPHYRLMLLIEQELPECNRREQIDEIAEKFCTNHGSAKNSRKRLLKTLFLVPRSRLDLLPYYSRMVATLDRVWNDIAPSLVTDLEQQFHGQAKFKKNQNIESRMRTARYVGELTKFRAAPPIVALRCLERCIEDFTGSNVEIACCILESCGRYLHRTKHTKAKVTALMETMTRLSKAKNLDERLQSLLKGAFYTVKPPPSGPRKKAKEYPPLEAYLRHLLLVRLDPAESTVSMVTKQLVRLPWNDPSFHCGALVCKIMLKSCRKGRYKTIEAVAAVAAKLRTQRAAGEVTIRLIDAVIEELRWALDNPNFRDQQRIITYARLLGELYCAAQVAGNIIIDQLYDFINSGHEIPESLREASKQLAAQAAAETTNSANVVSAPKVPVYNSSGGVSRAIQEDEEMEEPELNTNVEEPDDTPKPVAVSPYSIYDPRVPSQKDPPNSSYRITLVCTMLEVVSRSLVSRNNLPRLKGFLAAFQRYLFTKTTLPTDVEFALLDTFDMVDSQWKRVSRGTGRGGGADTSSGAEHGFPRYATWFDAHAATVVVEESEAVFEVQKRARLEALADESKSLAEINGPMDERSMNDDDTGSLLDEDDESLSVKSKDSAGTDLLVEDENVDVVAPRDDEEFGHCSGSDGEDDDEEESDDDDSEGETDEEEEEDEKEFDEEAYMLQLEEEAFERELRMVTMEAIEKGKNASRKQVGDSMISGSQIIKRKPTDSSKPYADPSAPTTGVALGGEVGISFQVLRKGNKGKVEAKELVVPVDTNLAMVATRQDDAAAREKNEIKQRVLRYEAQSESSGGNVYLEQEKLQRNRNRPLSMEEIDKNFGTSGGNLHPSQLEKKATIPNPPAQGRGVAGRSGGRGRGPAPGRGRGGRSNASGRTLFG